MPYATGDDFDELFDLVYPALSRRSPRRRAAMAGLLAAGPRAVRPLAFAIEAEIQDHEATDDDIDARIEAVSDAVRRIGEAALPELESLAGDGGCHMVVNEWAQEMVFDILGLEGEARQGVCLHGTVVREEGERVWRCLMCDAELGDGERPAYGDGPSGV